MHFLVLERLNGECIEKLQCVTRWPPVSRHTKCKDLDLRADGCGFTSQILFGPHQGCFEKKNKKPK